MKKDRIDWDLIDFRSPLTGKEKRGLASLILILVIVMLVACLRATVMA